MTVRARPARPKPRLAAPIWPLSAAALGALLLWRFDLLIGRSTFFFRDIQTTHAPALAAFHTLGFARNNPFASFGQPYLGNPNLLVAYPFPKLPGLISLHIILHLLLALIGMTLYLRELRLSADAAWFGALAFTGSGYVLSAASSLNSITTIGWLPLILALAERERQRRMTIPLRLAGAVLLAIFLVSGEPVLIALTLLVALARLAPWRRAALPALFWFAGELAAAALITLPVHLATWRAAAASYRVAHGYSFERAMAASLHPARLLELLVPFLFGDPSKLGPGSFWGYAVSRDTRPYVYSVSFSLLAITLAVCILSRQSLRERRFWVVLAAVTLVLSFGGFLPGAEALYAALPSIHAVRFPIKFLLFFALAVSVLAALSFEELLVGIPAAAARRAAVIRLGAICLSIFALALLAAMASQVLQRALIALWWNPRWTAAPELALAPIVPLIPARLWLATALVGTATWGVARGGGPLVRSTLHLLVAVEGLLLAGSLLPSVPASIYEQRSELVETAIRLDTPLFERAGKDLDPIQTGLRGRYTENDVRQLAAVQVRQGWSLSGVRHGLRYAFDPSPDGSYTERNQLVQELVDGAPWPLRLKWLRAAGVGAVITSDRVGHLPLVLRAQERKGGIPTALYSVRGTLPAIRRVPVAMAARSPQEAATLFGMPAFDEARAIVVEGRPLAGTPDATATVTVIGGDSDALSVETSGAAPAYLFLARSYTPTVRAFDASGRPLTVSPANATFIAVLVPAGRQRIRLEL
ncbi:MAG: hypothetical protein JWN02_559 [Acidobacteria bacterium]|nr:hypothetical protein [Acidobacteriota bacterium]